MPSKQSHLILNVINLPDFQNLLADAETVYRQSLLRGNISFHDERMQRLGQTIQQIRERASGKKDGEPKAL